MNITRTLLTGNFAKGRGGVPIDLLVIHIMDGSMAGTLSHFRRLNPKDPVSAHYGISRAGEVVQYVEDADTAWHAGRVQNPTSLLVKSRPKLNPNLYSIGIEHEGTASSGLTFAQMAASAKLLRLLAHRHRIPLDRTHVVGHREIFSGKPCPGKVNVDALVELAASRPDIEPKAPLKLDRIETPTPAHINEIIRVRQLDADEVAVGIAASEALARGVINWDFGRRGESIKHLADAMADWLKARTKPAA